MKFKKGKLISYLFEGKLLAVMKTLKNTNNSGDIIFKCLWAQKNIGAWSEGSHYQPCEDKTSFFDSHTRQRVILKVRETNREELKEILIDEL